MFKLCGNASSAWVHPRSAGSSPRRSDDLRVHYNGFVLHIYRLSRSGPILRSTPIAWAFIGPTIAEQPGLWPSTLSRETVSWYPFLISLSITQGRRMITRSTPCWIRRSLTAELWRSLNLEKFRGYPCIRGLEQLQDLRTRFKRLWIVQVPIGGGADQNPSVVAYLAEKRQGHVFELQSGN